MDDNKESLVSITSSIGGLARGLYNVQLLMQEALKKLDTTQNSVPMSLGYCWGPEAPILLLDGLGRRTSVPMIMARNPDVRETVHRCASALL
jgi:hypothetical protein